MSAKWILSALALVFAGAALWRFSRQGRQNAAARIWLRVALIFAAVSAWLWLNGTA